MSSDKVDVYARTDQAIRVMDRDSLRAFGQLKLAKWDELHIIREVTTLYRKSAKKARQQYYEIAFEAFVLGLMLCDMDSKEAHRLAEKVITGDWVDDVLSQTDFVMLYRFDTETERKAVRLSEALEAAEDKNAEIDKALRSWTGQLSQFAINFADYAMIAAYQEAGIEKVRWVSVPDEKRCSVCRGRHGRIYPIAAVPTKHPRCRCWVVPVRQA